MFVLRAAPAGGLGLFARMLALEFAHRAMRDANSPLPIWLDLSLWDDAQGVARRFPSKAQWQLISYWKHWLSENPAMFLLPGWDGLAARNQDAAAEFAPLDRL